MNKLLTTITVPEVEDEPIYHIPGTSVYITACGYVDVIYVEYPASEYRPNCPICIEVVRYYKNLKTGRLKGKLE
jgi:hypothetical protein